MSRGEAVRWALSWLATYGLHSTLFLGGAWLLCRLRPPRVERNRERVWKLALVGGVLSASLQLALGALPLLGRLELGPMASVPSREPEREDAAPTRPERAPALAEESARSPALPPGQREGVERAARAREDSAAELAPERAATSVAASTDPLPPPERAHEKHERPGTQDPLHVREPRHPAARTTH